MLEKLIKKLIEDKELFYGWQSNIAMAFIDAYQKSDKKYKNYQELHKIANEAAKNFLDLLTKEGK